MAAVRGAVPLDARGVRLLMLADEDVEVLDSHRSARSCPACSPAAAASPAGGSGCDQSGASPGLPALLPPASLREVDAAEDAARPAVDRGWTGRRRRSGRRSSV